MCLCVYIYIYIYIYIPPPLKAVKCEPEDLFVVGRPTAEDAAELQELGVYYTYYTVLYSAILIRYSL